MEGAANACKDVEDDKISMYDVLMKSLRREIDGEKLVSWLFCIVLRACGDGEDGQIVWVVWLLYLNI